MCGGEFLKVFKGIDTVLLPLYSLESNLNTKSPQERYGKKRKREKWALILELGNVEKGKDIANSENNIIA